MDMNISEQDYFIDIHTHSHSSDHTGDVIQIINLFPEQLIPQLAAQFFYSLGWHPWYLKKENNDVFLEIVSLILHSADDLCSHTPNLSSEMQYVAPS